MIQKSCFLYSKSFLGCLQCQFLSLLKGLLESTLHIECCLRVIITLALEKRRETLDCVLQLHELTLSAGKDLAHKEGLREELLDLSGTGHRQLVVL